MKKIPIELLGEYTVRVMDLPAGARGFVVYDDEDHANIYINARLSYDGQLDAADHEFAHVINDDIHSQEDIRTVEARAEGRSRRLDAIPHLMRAVDLLPPQPEPEPEPVQSVRIGLTSYQKAVVWRALDALDRALIDQADCMIALYDP